MAGGDRFSRHDRVLLDEAIRNAEQLSRVEFSLFVGTARGAARDFAIHLHGSLTAPTHSVLIMVDPQVRVLEVVTGSAVRETLPDTQVEQIVASMISAFSAGDLTGGLRRGIQRLAAGAHVPHPLPAGQD